jgi:drug/metabolite transporter (DMT)-like permease
MHIDGKTLIGVLIYVSFGIAGQLVLKGAIRQIEPFTASHPAEALRFFGQVVTTPAIIAGVALLAIHFSTFLALLSRADLSVVVPCTASSYLLLTLLARIVLHEEIPPQRWLGVLLVTLGVSLVLTSGGGRLRSRTEGRSATSPGTTQATAER